MKIGRSIGMLTFIFSKEVVPVERRRISGFRREGRSPLATATIMVGLFRIGIPMGICVDSCTMVEVLPEINYFPNYTCLKKMKMIRCSCFLMHIKMK